jgi:hypothetical protein
MMESRSEKEEAMSFRKLNAQLIAAEFLDQWKKAHEQAHGHPSGRTYYRLAKTFAQCRPERLSIDEVEAVCRALHEQRKARGLARSGSAQDTAVDRGCH